MNALLWVLQLLLAAAFLAHGLMFLFPSAEVAALMNTAHPDHQRMLDEAGTTSLQLDGPNGAGGGVKGSPLSEPWG